MLTATVSGSFHRHIREICQAVEDLLEAGINVLSPADPRIVGSLGDFLFVASDRVRSVHLVEDRHLEAIRASDFLWLVTPDGYLGQSASMELGFAVAYNVPVISLNKPFDLTLRQYVKQVKNLQSAVEVVAALASDMPSRGGHVLIDPNTHIDRIHMILEEMREALTGRSTEHDDEAMTKVYSARDKIVDLLRSR